MALGLIPVVYVKRMSAGSRALQRAVAILQPHCCPSVVRPELDGLVAILRASGPARATGSAQQNFTCFEGPC